MRATWLVLVVTALGCDGPAVDSADTGEYGVAGELFAVTSYLFDCGAVVYSFEAPLPDGAFYSALECNESGTVCSTSTRLDLNTYDDAGELTVVCGQFDGDLLVKVIEPHAGASDERPRFQALETTPDCYEDSDGSLRWEIPFTDVTGDVASPMPADDLAWTVEECEGSSCHAPTSGWAYTAVNDVPHSLRGSCDELTGDLVVQLFTRVH